MMGSGKTSVGQLLSKYLKSTFYDLDSGIEKRFNLTITEIFNEYGEERFREAESSLLFETNNLENYVISTGGGIVINDTNRKFLRDQRVYYLNNSVETIYERAAKKRKQIQTPSYDQVIKPIYSEASGRWKIYQKQIENIYPILEPWIKKFNY